MNSMLRKLQTMSLSVALLAFAVASEVQRLPSTAKTSAAISVKSASAQAPTPVAKATTIRSASVKKMATVATAIPINWYMHTGPDIPTLRTGVVQSWRYDGRQMVFTIDGIEYRIDRQFVYAWNYRGPVAGMHINFFQNLLFANGFQVA